MSAAFPGREEITRHSDPRSARPWAYAVPLHLAKSHRQAHLTHWAHSPGDRRRAFLLRLRPEVLAAVERHAAAELRSVNAQVETSLREALGRRGVGIKAPRSGEEL